MRVLVIDDDLKTCELIKRSLEKDFKKAVVECYDFLPDIENLSDDYDLIFLDIVFDHHNGNYGSNIMTYKKTVSEVEKITGFKFFPGLPDSSVKDTIIDSKWN